MSVKHHFLWDSCCFIRFVTRDPDEGLNHLDHLVADARKGLIQIHFSTIVYAEFRPRYFVGSKYGRIENFFADMGSAFVPHEPNPNILMFAGRLRDAQSVNPAPSGKSRPIGAADAIHLATAVFVKQATNKEGLIIHSFDMGKGRTHEGKCVPIVGFETWFPHNQRNPEVSAVCEIENSEPKHPIPDLLTKGTK